MLRNHLHVPPLMGEADELVRILAVIVHRADRNRGQEPLLLELEVCSLGSGI